MWKCHKKTIIITALLCLVPTVVGLILWDKLPERIPTHFGASNDPNGWSGKSFAVFGIPAMIAVLELLCVVIANIDPKKQNITPKVMVPVLWMMPALSWLVMAVSYAAALGKQWDVGTLCMVFVGLTMIVLGNYMPKAKQNYTVGVKVPWALNDEENWNHTNRLAGYTFTIGGVLVAVMAFFHWLWLPLAVVLLCALIPTVYSYLYYKKYH